MARVAAAVVLGARVMPARTGAMSEWFLSAALGHCHCTLWLLWATATALWLLWARGASAVQHGGAGVAGARCWRRSGAVYTNVWDNAPLRTLVQLILGGLFGGK